LREGDGMSNTIGFDAQLSQQLNRRDADEETARQESNAENYREMRRESARLTAIIAELEYSRLRSYLVQQLWSL